ncbi:MAG: hypothetical protein LUI06_06880 [Ruminococcus sp.]|nr:hypothetical protein [Ruminococcus sp.]
MPIMVEREKWILYKHTNNYALMQAVALDVKNSCGTNISDTERYRMQERLAALDMYKTRNPKERPLDSINHRINTLEYYMFGYEDKGKNSKRFIFSPLGNLFIEHINEPEKLLKIFTTMLFGIQFEHPANGTPVCFQLYPFRLIFKLLTDERLDCRLYNSEYVYFIAFQKTVTPESYEKLVSDILEFRKLSKEEVADLMRRDEHTYVNCVYEWQYYTQKLLNTAGVINSIKGDEIVSLYHPQKTNSHSAPTKRKLTAGYVSLTSNIKPFVELMLETHSCFQKPLLLNDAERMRLDVVKEIYSFYPKLLLDEIGEEDEIQVKLLELPKLIEKYSHNPDNDTAYLFEDVLEEGFNLFVNVEAKKIGGAGHTDIECLYITKHKKFAVEAKSTGNKLSLINAGRLKEHREQIGGDYTIVITPRYVPAAKRDIKGNPIVIILASTFSEYLYNHIYHDVREIDFDDFDSIIINNFGTDISKLISDRTMEKFATRS